MAQTVKTGALHLTRIAGMARCVSAVLDSFIQAVPCGTRQYSVSMHVTATAFRGELLKKLYEFKCACHFYDERTDWDFHAEHCIRCQQLKLWLSLSFLQSYYFACADVGPPSSSLTSICDVKDDDVPKDYDKDYALAVIRSKVIGGVLFVSTLFFLGVFVIIYGEIENYLKKFDLSGNGQDILQVQVSVVRAVHPGRWNPPVPKATEFRLSQVHWKL
ncbi:hypothetical protein OS493_029957 [Desmophyllum pertusum]|uniref:Uncharacterized protein n=1 Tax=Desmophyllum pertusum TaxID=174260 RepID=A0A9W9ZYW1_9CNID|nr:hypothetical protein OS493_029957 [Desmophyllum pertusum]